ncbi:hypothetical protein GW17_00007084 [Ensete ventricosum]|nr:hypothetical protein GW17_00007084 [Ensete ventricosum]RZR81821.1 hypothetical protein BHM03_00008123 [Ensete ventricosum]
MEEITEGVNNLHVTAADYHKKNRIQVSNTKKPLFFYVNLAKVLPQFPTWKSLVFCVVFGLEDRDCPILRSYFILFSCSS